MGIELGLQRDQDGFTGIYAAREAERAKFFSYINTNQKLVLRIVDPEHVNNRLFSRFIAKIGLEVLTGRVIGNPGWEDAVIFRPELDDIRQYARYGNYGKAKMDWPISTRRIYDEHYPFHADGEIYEVLHEFQTLFVSTDLSSTTSGAVEGQLLVVIAILGMEYVLNLGNPETKTYTDWLAEHNNISPLYSS